MTADQIIAIGTALTGLVSLAGAYSMRWLTRAGRTIRRQRDAIEQAEELLYRTRQAALRYGVTRAQLPKVPDGLFEGGLLNGDSD